VLDAQLSWRLSAASGRVCITSTQERADGEGSRVKIRSRSSSSYARRACRNRGAGAESIGPLAEFDGADHWVVSPAKNGVALIGDAAASSDPSWGCGLSLTLLDVEHLSNALCANDDWSTALTCYAKAHDEYYSALHRILGWMTELMWKPGAEAEQRRGRVFPRMMSDPRGFPDAIGLGPFGPSDDRARRLVLGLE